MRGAGREIKRLSRASFAIDIDLELYGLKSGAGCRHLDEQEVGRLGATGSEI